MKEPMFILTTDFSLLNGNLSALNSGLGWVEVIEKPTPVAHF